MNQRSDDLDFSDADWERLARYLAGESDDAEAAAVRSWLADDPSRAALVDALERSLGTLDQAPPRDLDVEAALRNVRARIEAEATETAPAFRADEGARVAPAAAAASVEPPAAAASGERPAARSATRASDFERRVRARRPWHSPAFRAAAGVLVVLGAALVWRSTRQEAPPIGLEYATGVGERTSIDLQDGSSVVLGPDSRLAVGEDYGAATRTVGLEGEAYFHVAHDASLPFRVEAGGAVIEDLGTAFLVRTEARAGGGADDAAGGPSASAEGATATDPTGAGAARLRVVVTEGSVRVEPPANGKAVVLAAGDRAVLDADGVLAAERGVDTEAEIAWTEGRLAFRDAPLERVAADLRRWYGVVLRVDPALAGRRLTATFESEERADVLEVLGLALGASVEVAGDTAIITPTP